MRRRGEKLERALLEAAWGELSDNGYSEFTVDAVARRAGTSKPVVYRRWPDKQALTRAAVSFALSQLVVEIPDTGSLRGDLIALLESLNTSRVSLAALISVHLGAYFRETGTTLADLRSALRGPDHEASTVPLYARAISRGEIDPEKLTQRIANLPIDLFRQEVLMTLKPMDHEDVEEIIDTIFLPLVIPDDRGTHG